MEHFDLDIDNYEKEELEEIFELTNITPYTKIDIEKGENLLKEKVITDKNINNSTRNKILRFLNDIKTALTKGISSIQEYSSDFRNTVNLNGNLEPSPVTQAGNTFLIDAPNTPYQFSFPSAFHAGVINPLKKRTIRQSLNIDTRFRNNYYGSTSSSFGFGLPLDLTNIVSMELSAFEFPIVNYAISRQLGNNFFSVIIGTTETIFIVPDGNYTPGALVDYLNNYAENYSSGPIPLLFSLNLFGDLNLGVSGSNQIIISLIQNPNNDTFILNFANDIYGSPDLANPLPLKLGWMMGFRNGIYENNNNYVSEGLVDLTGSKYIYLVVDDYNNNVNNGFYSAFNSSILNKNILARISIKNNLINSQFVTTPREYFGPVTIQKLQIQLLDEYGRILEVNNMDYSFCLTFVTIYDL
jgi:hypothetical protein